MKISIITAVFNSEDTIGRALRSVHDQSHLDVEHIVIDGKSSDGTLEIVNSLKDERVVVVSEPDKGMYDALNKGISLACGDVIGLLHADDVFSNNHILERVADQFLVHDVDAIYGDAVFFSKSEPDTVVRHYRSGRFAPKRLGWGWMPAHTTLFLRRKVFKRFGLFKTDYKIAADYEFVCRIFRDEEIRAKYLPEVMIRMQLGGLSTKGWKNTLVLNREVMRACRENKIDTNWLKLLSKYPLKAFEYFNK